MPRNASGIYSLPTGNPVVPSTLITSNWANTTLSDIATALTQSMPIDGSVMTASFVGKTITGGTFNSPVINNATIASPTITGGVTFTGGSNRIKGDFTTNTPLAQRTLFQTTTANSGSGIGVIPNGTGVGASIFLASAQDPDNASLCTLGISGIATTLASTFLGTGTAMPLALSIAGVERFRCETNGNITIPGNSRRIQADFSNSTFASRTFFQTSALNTLTNVGFIPNGTGAAGGISCYNNSDPTNSCAIQLVSSSSAASLSSTAIGSGTVLPLSLQTSGVERMRIEADGRISLTGGPASPWAGGIGRTIDFNTGALYNGTVLENLYFDGTNFRRKQSGGASLVQQGGGNHAFYGFLTNSAGTVADINEGTVLFIRGDVAPSNRGVGIGTTAIASKLHVSSDLTNLPGVRVSGQTAGDASFPPFLCAKFDNVNTTAQVLFRFTINSGGIGQGQITGNGAGLATFSSFSDARLKENIVDVPSQLVKIMALRPREFDFKDGSGHNTGFVAQEIQQVFPEAVAEGIDHNGERMLMVAGWAKTEAILVKAIQEQQAIINNLATRISALEAALNP